MQVIDGLKDDFHSGRPAGNFGPPVSLFNHALGLFDYHLCHLDDESSTVDLPPSLTELAHVFMVVAANSYPDGSTRTAAIKHILNRIFTMPLNWEVSETRFGIKPDAINFGNTFFRGGGEERGWSRRRCFSASSAVVRAHCNITCGHG